MGEGPARSSTLDLRYSQRDPAKWGVAKAPVAAGRGSGGRLHDIVPGRPEASILVFRITSTEPGVAMPELGKRLVHEEGVALIREWIETMEDPIAHEDHLEVSARSLPPVLSPQPGCRLSSAPQDE